MQMLASHSPLRQAGGFAAIAAGLALSVAYVSELGFGLRPCELCLAQRVPYALLVVIGILLALLPRGRLLPFLVLVLFAGEAGLAFYHAGVEWRILPGPTACSGGGTAAADLDALKAQIEGAALVSCGDVAFRFLGLSMAGWNMLYALGCALVAGRLIARGGRDVAAG